MIRKLQIRFIAAAMLSLTVVLAVILSTVNLVSYRKTVKDADAVLAVLAENQGRFPIRGNPIDDRRHEIRQGIASFERREFSPEMPFESRYFTVEVSGDGTVQRQDMRQIAAVDALTAEECAKAVLEQGKEKGFWGDYRYLVVQQSDSSQIIFLDCGRNITANWVLFQSSLLVSLIVLAAVLLLLIPASGRIVKPVAESYEKQRRFITDASHEIKTPLTIISADADLLELEAGENEWLEDIRRQTKRLADLTGDLVYLSRMDEAQPKLQMVEFPLSDVVEETAQTFLAPATRQDKKLLLSIASMLSLKGSEKEIRQLVSILLDNALKYSPPGSEIRVCLTAEGKGTKLSVTNRSAQPLEREKLRDIFDRFYRLEASRNSSAGGYGLGLSIARSIVTAHKGKIRAESADGETLTITAVFPG